MKKLSGFSAGDGSIGACFEDIYLVAGKRTPFGKLCGSLSTVSPTDLGILAARAALADADLNPTEIDQTYVANIGQAAADAFFLPRHVALYSGVPMSRPALLVQRICGSGIEVIANAAQEIALGKARVVLGCGTDTMSRFPLVSYSARQGFALGRPEYTDLLWEALNDTAAVPMGCTADNLASQYGIAREEVDAYAFASQQRYFAAQESGFFAAEIEAVVAKGVIEQAALKPRKYRLKSRDGLAQDEHPRQTTRERLAGLAPVFSAQGPTTAGNASGIVDGAAAVILADGDYVRAHGLKPLGKINGYAASGVDPNVMGIGPVPAIRALLAEQKLTLADIDRVEVNEAFAAQCLAVGRELKLDPEKLNVNGGAIAIGHPLAATGVRLALTCLRTLERDQGTLGIASACIGGGQGVALLVERC